MKTGFVFDGETYDEKIEDMVRVFDEALTLWEHDQPKWKKIKANAKKARFTWEKSLDDYYKSLYLL
jgi:starch synthase